MAFCATQFLCASLPSNTMGKTTGEMTGQKRRPPALPCPRAGSAWAAQGFTQPGHETPRPQSPDLPGPWLHGRAVLVRKRLLLISILSPSCLSLCPASCPPALLPSTTGQSPAASPPSPPGGARAAAGCPLSCPFCWLNWPHTAALPHRARPSAPVPWCFPSLLPVLSTLKRYHDC